MKTTLPALGLAFAHVAWATDAPPNGGYERDRVLIRSTYRLTGPGCVHASSAESSSAAHRLFNNMNFVGLSRERVLAILGDPKTIRDSGIPAEATADSPLTYRFDSGFGAWDYLIRFAKGVVTKVDPRCGLSDCFAEVHEPARSTQSPITPLAKANKTDAGNGSHGICRVSNSQSTTPHESQPQDHHSPIHQERASSTSVLHGPGLHRQ